MRTRQISTWTGTRGITADGDIITNVAPGQRTVIDTNGRNVLPFQPTATLPTRVTQRPARRQGSVATVAYTPFEPFQYDFHILVDDECHLFVWNDDARTAQYLGGSGQTDAWKWNDWHTFPGLWWKRDNYPGDERIKAINRRFQVYGRSVQPALKRLVACATWQKTVNGRVYHGCWFTGWPGEYFEGYTSPPWTPVYWNGLRWYDDIGCYDTGVRGTWVRRNAILQQMVAEAIAIGTSFRRPVLENPWQITDTTGPLPPYELEMPDWWPTMIAREGYSPFAGMRWLWDGSTAHTLAVDGTTTTWVYFQFGLNLYMAYLTWWETVLWMSREEDA